MPPPYPGTNRSAARKERARTEPPFGMIGAKRWTIETIEYEEADAAAR